MYKKGVLTVGTLRTNRIPNLSLTDQKLLNKKPRGYYEEYVGQILGVPLSTLAWNDNKVVTFLSTFVGGIPGSTCQRFSKESHGKINIYQLYCMLSEYITNIWMESIYWMRILVAQKF